MPEISDAELAELRGAHKLLDAVMKNPETKNDAHRIIKKLNPKAVIPEYDLRESMGGEVAALKKQIDALTDSLKQKDELGTYQVKFDAATSKHGITEEGKAKVLELMTERKIHDPEAGVLLFNELNPPPSPTTNSGWAGSTMFDDTPDTELGQWLANPDKRRDDEIRSVLNERKAA